MKTRGRIGGARGEAEERVITFSRVLSRDSPRRVAGRTACAFGQKRKADDPARD